MENLFVLRERIFRSSRTIFFLLVILLNIITPSHGAAQPSKKLDSLKNELKKHTVKDTAYLKDLIFLASEQRNEDIELSMRYYKEALSISKNLSEVKYEIKSNTGLGICSAMLDQHSDAIHFFENALKLSIKNGFTEYTGDSYNNLGIVYKYLDDYPLSLKFYAKSTP
jgi:tetratricopeptide (TPR) repeat protein